MSTDAVPPPGSGPSPVEGVIRELDAFLDSVVAPLELEHDGLLRDPGRRYDQTGIRRRELVEIERTVRMQAASAGLYGLMIPSELGGRGLDPPAQYSVWRHLYGRSGPDRPLPYEAVGRFTSGPGAALLGMGPSARAQLWPAILSGDKLLCFALTETGTSGNSVRTRAVPTPGGYRLSGRKRWVSRGGYAEFALVYAFVALERPGDELAAPSGAPMSAFLVPLRTSGVRVAGPERILGRAGGEEVVLEFDGVAVPEGHLVGELHGGQAVARSGAITSAMFTAGRFVGLAHWALSRASDVVVQGGAVESTELMLGKAVAELRSVELLAQRCAELAVLGSGATDLRLLQMRAPAMCGRVYEAAMRLEGNEGLSNDARLFDGLHQSLIVQVAQGAMASTLRRELREALFDEATRETRAGG